GLRHHRRAAARDHSRRPGARDRHDRSRHGSAPGRGNPGPSHGRGPGRPRRRPGDGAHESRGARTVLGGERMTTPVIEFRDVDAYYGAAQALFGIDFTLAEGETVALLGRNGAGKTTTMRTAMNILVKRTGTV